jgi:hypothetical protein
LGLPDAGGESPAITVSAKVSDKCAELPFGDSDGGRSFFSPSHIAREHVDDYKVGNGGSRFFADRAEAAGG